MLSTIFLVFIVFLLVMVVAANVRIVPQANVYVIERLGGCTSRCPSSTA